MAVTMPAAEPLRVLILDDEATVGTLIDIVARTAGAETLLTSRPAAFFAALDSWQPSHLVVDLQMPEMSGRQVLTELALRGCRARVIVTSGDPVDLEATQHEHAAGLQIQGILPKPFAANTLRGLLAR